MKNLIKLKFLFFMTTTFLLGISPDLRAQNIQLKGLILDARDQLPIPGATILLLNETDSTLSTGTVSNPEGIFLFSKLEPAKYKIKISSIGYSTREQEIAIAKDTVLPTILLDSDTKQLSEVIINSEQVRMEVKGDTIQYNADAFKVHPDATSEDLLKKMPGVTTDGSTIKVNGEEVKKILVDGKPFFSDDPTLTLRSLPADIVGTVQVFDQASDQAQFTGFKDGNEQKTINLNTKKGMNVGQFGKVYGGYGTDERYNAGFNYNSFNGSRRISVIGMSNNINQQNFSISDLMSVMSNSDGGQRMGPPAAGGSMDFLSGQQSGITKTNAIGLNYSDTWGKKIKVSGNYFFNHTDNATNSSVLRSYYIQNGLTYDQNSDSQNKNLNHKINFKFEYYIDSINKLTITPRFTFQSNSASSLLDGNTKFNNEELINSINNKTASDGAAYNFNNDVLWQHKFRKKGRTFSVNLNTQISNSNKEGNYYSSNLFNDSLIENQLVDQKYDSKGKSTTYGANLSYTEALGKTGQLLFSYKPSYTINNEIKNVYDADSPGVYSDFNTSLSNQFENTYSVQKGGINYSLNLPKGMFTIGSDIQQAKLVGNQLYPGTSTVERDFMNFLPATSFTHNFDNTFNLNITYKSSTRAPSISQLQNIIDQSNALFVRYGNPLLNQSYENNFTIRMMKRLMEKERHFMVFIRGTQTNNYIGNSTTILSADSTIQNVLVKQGSQLISYANLNNYYGVNAFGVFGLPLKALKSNLNIHAGYNLTNTPALINDQLNYALNNGINAGFYLGSNISQYLDFSIGYKGSYNTVSNSFQVQSNSSYLNHVVTLKANYYLFKKIILGTDVNQNYYTGLSSGFNQSFTLWNASIGYKFLKNESLEMKISAYDILNQNTSISRNITETYIEDNQTQVLKQYFLFSLTYTFKHFKNGSLGPDEMKIPKGMPPPENLPLPPIK